MRLRTKSLLSLSAGLGAVALAATPAWAVNTSYLYFNTNPATQQSVLCQYGTSGSVLHPSELYKVRNNCSVRMWLMKMRTDPATLFASTRTRPRLLTVPIGSG